MTRNQIFYEATDLKVTVSVNGSPFVEVVAIIYSCYSVNSDSSRQSSTTTGSPGLINMPIAIDGE